jgi:hypothetical protein
MEMNNTSSTDAYFAAKPAKDCASVLLGKADSFFNILRANAFLDKMSRMWAFYYGNFDRTVGYGHSVGFAGEQGELVTFPVNHFRNLAQHIYVMITSNRPIMEARAINTDYKSMAQTYLANGILEYYMREKRLEECLKKATELAIVLGAGYVKLSWNATGGDIYDTDPETEEPIREGDLEFTNLTPFDVVVDGTKESWDNDWVLCRTFKNRYDLMAKYPELSDKIKALPSKHQSAIYRLAIFSNDETDDIPVFEFYHKPTEAMPEGRYMLFLADEVVLLDTKMPYRVIPVFRIAPNDLLGTPYGYSPMFDIYPLQEAINALFGSIMTNQNAFGVQNIFVPRGADINVNTLQGQMNIIEGNAKPEPLNLTETPAEVFKFLEMVIQNAETISGVNSVARGNPEASLKSGTALALVQSMALQFISGLQQAYVRLIEDVGTAVIQILKDFATTPKVVAIVGKNNRPLLKEFTGEKISSINRVIVDVGNPLSRTIAGRVQMAEQMMQMKLITDPQQYFQVISTGKIESMYEGEMSELLLIKSENEQMMEGQDVITSPLDKHQMHIMEHRAVLADPELRKDKNLVQIVLNHVKEHLDFLRNTDPALLGLIGEQPVPPVQGTPPSPETLQMQMPPQGALNNSPIPEQMGPAGGGQVPPGQMPGPGQSAISIPEPANPPGQFKNLPTNPAEIAPPTI